MGRGRSGRGGSNSISTLSESNRQNAPLTKQEQYEIIVNANPAEDDYHTWIRSVDDINTFEEVIQDYIGEDVAPDFTAADIEAALRTGRITVYSSHPIINGNFVTPSRMEAQSYAGSGQIYTATVNITDVAWIDEIQGQLARRRR